MDFSSTEIKLIENQSSSALPKNTKKPYILTSIFILMLLIAGVITVVTVITIQSSYKHDPTPSKSIQAICSFAPYKHLCIFSLLSSISADTSADKFDTRLFPENIIFQSFQLCVYQLIHLANISNPDDNPELQECRALLNKELSGLNDSVASSKNLYFFTGLEVYEYVEVFNRMKTYQPGSSMIDEIRLNVQDTRKYMFNSRAILLNIDTILDNLYGRSLSLSSSFTYYYDSLSKYYWQDFDWLGVEFMIIYVP